MKCRVLVILTGSGAASDGFCITAGASHRKAQLVEVACTGYPDRVGCSQRRFLISAGAFHMHQEARPR